MSKAKTATTVASAACLAMACASIKPSEGLWLTVKPDRLAGGLPTGGYGETEGVKLGETHDEKFWSDRLTVRLADEYDAGIGKCIHVELPDGVRAAGLSIAYNAGVGALCGSQIVARWNAGDLRGGCAQILTRNAQGAYTGFRIASRPQKGGPLVVQRGLINRRAKEQRDCFAAAHDPIGAQAAAKVAAAPDPLPPLPVVPTPAPAAVEAKPAPATAPAPSFWHRLYCWFFKCSK